MTIKGGHVQSLATVPPVSVSDHAGPVLSSAAAPSTANWRRIKYISFTRTKNPARHRSRNDHHGKGKAECHPQKGLKVGAIERASPFFRRAPGKAFEFHKP